MKNCLQILFSVTSIKNYRTPVILNFMILHIMIGIISQISYAKCQIKNSDGSPIKIKTDPLYRLLEKSSACPENAQSLRSLIKNEGLILKTSMVANRGFHNPSLGSFSFFEEVMSTSKSRLTISEGEFFFGHFTTLVGGLLELDQTPELHKLMIELIVWDKEDGLFNFYELIGTATEGQWFYRGNSTDILNDNTNLYLDPQPGAPKFGTTLRCAGCHISGGPIMKEISQPHNDWWTKLRPLPFGKMKLSNSVSKIVSNLLDAENFSQAVKKGIQTLEDSQQFQKFKSQMPLQIQLRPLFCETEINLESDLEPFQANTNAIKVPSTSVVNPILGQHDLTLAKQNYLALLDLFKMKFPETNQNDGDHAWLVPVKGYSDLLSIQSLIKRGIITEEFALDVLAVDFQQPLFSTKRCDLLELIPKSGGLEAFTENLRVSNLPSAQDLYKNLTDPKKNKQLHIMQAFKRLNEVQSNLNSAENQKHFFQNLINQRKAVFESEISKNPKGQILEPGFRVIFPLPQ